MVLHVCNKQLLTRERLLQPCTKGFTMREESLQACDKGFATSWTLSQICEKVITSENETSHHCEKEFPPADSLLQCCEKEYTREMGRCNSARRNIQVRWAAAMVREEIFRTIGGIHGLMNHGEKISVVQTTTTKRHPRSKKPQRKGM